VTEDGPQCCQGRIDVSNDHLESVAPRKTLARNSESNLPPFLDGLTFCKRSLLWGECQNQHSMPLTSTPLLVITGFAQSILVLNQHFTVQGCICTVRIGFLRRTLWWTVDVLGHPFNRHFTKKRPCCSTCSAYRWPKPRLVCVLFGR